MQTSNEQSLSAGEIYFHILRCDDQSDAEMIDWWWAQIQSSDERKELKKLFARRNLNAAFRKLARFHGLGPEMRAGMVGSLLRLKCDEEIIRYLTHIHDSWSYILNYNAADFQKLTIKLSNNWKVGILLTRGQTRTSCSLLYRMGPSLTPSIYRDDWTSFRG